MMELINIVKVSLQELKNSITRLDLICICSLNLNCTNLEIDGLSIILISIEKIRTVNSYIRFRRGKLNLVAGLLNTTMTITLTTTKMRKFFTQYKKNKE